jgi:aminoglycoside 3-N-acetyltransferase
MSERKLIEGTQKPHTRQDLTADLNSLGVTEGDVLLVHTSLSAVGWVCGGPVTFIHALLDAVGDSGTIAMPSHSTGNTDPAGWSNPPTPEEWWPVIRENMPAFEPGITPTREMGVVAELFRTWPGALRSSHPTYSFSAVGPSANKIVNGHQLDFALGEGSPLARLYELDAKVLLVGVDYNSNTSFHLAEYRTQCRPRVRLGAALLEEGRRVWRSYDDLDLGEDVFNELAQPFDASEAVAHGRVGSADSRLFSQREAVDFATQELSR